QDVVAQELGAGGAEAEGRAVGEHDVDGRPPQGVEGGAGRADVAAQEVGPGGVEVEELAVGEHDVQPQPPQRVAEGVDLLHAAAQDDLVAGRVPLPQLVVDVHVELQAVAGDVDERARRRHRATPAARRPAAAVPGGRGGGVTSPATS